MMTQLVILLIALASVHLTCVHAKGGAAKGGAAGEYLIHYFFSLFLCPRVSLSVYFSFHSIAPIAQTHVRLE